jgi:hypothetical protein
MILPGPVNPTYQRIDKKLCDVYHVEARRKLQFEDGKQICGVCIRLCPFGRAV